MTASLETLVIAAYVFATSVAIPRPGPLHVAELIAEGQIRLVDGTLISCANYRAAPRAASSRATLAMATPV